MIQYKYYRAVSLDGIANVLKEHDDGTYIVTGETNILVQIHEKDKRRKDLRCLLDIAYLDREPRYANEGKEHVYIGPLSVHTDLEQSEIIAEHIPLLGQASAAVGSPQIHDRGTLGGSIDNGFPASGPLPTLIAADALIRVHGRGGEREYLFKDFYEGKGSLKLEPGELIHKFVVKKLPRKTGMGFPELSRRKTLAISRLNCAAALTLSSEGIITKARIVPGCVLVQPGGMEKTGRVLVGQKPSEELLIRAGETASEAMIERIGVRWPTRYKEPAVQEIVLRTLCQTAGTEI